MGLRSALAAALGISAGVSTPVVAQAGATQTVVEYVERSRPRGGAGTRISAGLLEDLDHNAEVRGSKWYGEPGKLGVAGKMLRDPHVRVSVNYVLNPVCSAKWRFMPTSKAAGDRRVADACTWAFFENLPWAQYARRIGISYFANGFALEEITDDIRQVPARLGMPGNRGLVPTGFHQRPAWTVHRWYQSEDNPAQIAGIQQWLSGSDTEDPGFVDVPASRLLRFTWDQEGADFEGLAPLRSAYPPWRIKMILQTIDAIAHERFGVGTPVGTAGPDASDEDLDALELALAELRSMEKGSLIIPEGWEVEWLTGQAGTNLHQAILRQNQDIAINLGAGHMMLGQVGPGSYALAGSQEGQLHREVDSHARFIASVLHRGSDGWSPVERFVRANFGEDVEVPCPRALYLPTRNWDAIAKTYSVLVQTRAVRADGAKESALLEAMDLPPFDEETAFALAAEAEPAGGPGDEPPADDDTEATPPESPEESEGEEVAA